MYTHTHVYHLNLAVPCWEEKKKEGKRRGKKEVRQKRLVLDSAVHKRGGGKKRKAGETFAGKSGYTSRSRITKRLRVVFH